MKVSTQVHITVAGFVVAYFAGMAAIVARSSERLGAWRQPLLWDFFIPLTLLGLVVILVAALIPAVEDEEPGWGDGARTAGGLTPPGRSAPMPVLRERAAWTPSRRTGS